MPHKRNPILAERVSGMARLLRGDAMIGLENMALWHERDISHSSAERFVFERALGVAAYATRSMAGLLRRPRGRRRADGRATSTHRRDGLFRGAAARHGRQGCRSPGGVSAGAGQPPRAPWSGGAASAPSCSRTRGWRLAQLRRNPGQPWISEHHLAGIDHDLPRARADRGGRIACAAFLVRRSKRDACRRSNRPVDARRAGRDRLPVLASTGPGDRAVAQPADLAFFGAGLLHLVTLANQRGRARRRDRPAGALAPAC